LRRRDTIFFDNNQYVRSRFQMVEIRTTFLPCLVLQCLKKVLGRGHRSAPFVTEWFDLMY